MRILTLSTSVFSDIEFRQYVTEVLVDDVRQRQNHLDLAGRRENETLCERYVRMANLASVGSHAINGVAALHTELLKKDVLRDFYEMYPDRFSNKTNGITPRRWLLSADPRLAALITSHIGGELERLEPLADDARFRRDWQECQKQ